MSHARRRIVGERGGRRALNFCAKSEALEDAPKIPLLLLIACLCFSQANCWLLLCVLSVSLLHFFRTFAPFHGSVGWSHALSSLLKNLIAGVAPLFRNQRLHWFRPEMWLKRSCSTKSAENVDETGCSSFLELPELALEEILERLPAASLFVMATVTSKLRARCSSDYFWEPLLKEKWGKVVGAVAYREWQWSAAFNHDSGSANPRSCNFWRWNLACMWPFYLLSSVDKGKKVKQGTSVDSLMAWFSALESGKFWFPAQVYNREHGHVGFVLSCYDAELSYDRAKDSFKARYPPHGPHTLVIEEDVTWDRVRAAPVNTSAHDLYISTNLADLRPGDHVEVQWRRNKEFPYGWWYGIVGHQDACNQNSSGCQCHLDDMLWLEFNQFAVGSRWRRSSVRRHTHHEEGNEVEGFYGGIRKLHSAEEIFTWKQLWPKETLE